MQIGKYEARQQGVACLDDQVDVGELAQVPIRQLPRLGPALGRQQAQAVQLLNNLGLYVGVLADAVPALSAQTCMLVEYHLIKDPSSCGICVKAARSPGFRRHARAASLEGASLPCKEHVEFTMSAAAQTAAEVVFLHHPYNTQGGGLHVRICLTSRQKATVCDTGPGTTQHLPVPLQSRIVLCARCSVPTADEKGFCKLVESSRVFSSRYLTQVHKISCRLAGLTESRSQCG